MEMSGELIAKESPRAKGPCLGCRAAHIKCDQLQPACGPCLQREASCRYFDTTPAKRKRTSIGERIGTGKACLTCRQKKIRCDGEKPVCGGCQKKSLVCRYGDTPKQPSSRPQSVKKDQTVQSPLYFNPVRLPSSIEQKRSTKKARLSSPYIVSDEPSPVSKKEQRAHRPAEPRHARPESISETSSDEGEGQASEQESYVSADEVGNTTGDVQTFVSRLDSTVPEPQHIIHSERSIELGDAVDGNFNNRAADQSPFVTKIKQAIFQRNDISRPGCSMESTRELERLAAIRKSGPELKTTGPDRKDLILPSRQVADNLVTLYLTRELVYLPIFPISSFLARYTAAWSGEDLLEDLGVFRGIINVMFALGCLLISPDNQSDATMYFMRAQNLICLNSVKGDSILHVQAQIIASQYLLAVNNLDAAWKSIGLAIRIAESLRLNLASGSHHLPLQEDRELARRLWHSCMIIERTIAMNRGSCIVKRISRQSLPFPLENEYVDTIFGGEPMRDTDRPSIIEFFTALARLYEAYDGIYAIQNELRLTGNVTPRKKLMCFDMQTLFNVDNILYDWQASLPPFLQPDAKLGILRHPIAARQRNILRIRYLYMRLLLWRPFLAIIAASPDISPRPPPISDSQQKQRHVVNIPLSFTIAHESSVKCILAAHEIVDLLSHYEHSQPNSGPVPASWENIGYVYACANVFIAARRCPESIYREVDGGANFIEQGWRLSTGLLDLYRTFSHKAAQCLKAVNELDELITYTGETADGLVPWGGEGFADMSWLESLPIDLDD